MLKFLRKYQLILLAIGGSLLMVVFLIGPIIQQVGPSLADKTVATMHGGTKKVSIFESTRATMTPDVIREVFPFMFYDSRSGFPGLIRLEDEGSHWLLLTTEAREAGLIGEADDGRLWLEQELASVFALYEVQFQLLQQWQGNAQIAQMMMQQRETQEAIATRTADWRSGLPARARQVAQRRGMPDDEVFKMLAEARGVLRLMRRHERMARPTDRQVVEALKEARDEAIVDFVLIPADRLSDQVGEPTDEQLSAHFERFRDAQPGSGDLGMGYTLPSRVKLGWLVLDYQAIAASIKPDRVLVRKRYSEDRAAYPGEFEDERARIEREIVDQQVNDLMIDADRIIQGRIRAALKDSRRVDGYYQIDEHWGGVTMESLAEAVVQDIKDQRGIDFPQPGITYRVDEWFTSEQLAGLEGIGHAYWQIGPNQIPVSNIPSMARGLGDSKQVLIQKRVPVADPPARDNAGNRYYIVLFETRPQSPPDSWEEIREQVTEDYKRIRAYELLKEQVDDLKALAQAEGLEAVAARFNREKPEPTETEEEVTPAPEERDLYVSRWAAVSQGKVGNLDFAKAVDLRANTEAFRKAVLAYAAQLDPMTPFGEIPADRSVLGVELPSQQAVAIAQVQAYRPATLVDRFEISPAWIDGLAQSAFRDVENLSEHLPFSLAALRKRLDFQYRRDRGEEADEEATE
ncbi:MAG: hypothetical protein DYG94_02155 [Leptolyngbya sp. PLA3]|nr:MAG: hypothetical protein EDM82_02400 [Cyanobacteria bacterium CYA]MCE7967535.1 hypothetical protein [Leptolyngbya sp. PL-A3]